MTPETGLRWGVTVAALCSLVGLAFALDATVSPVAAFAVLTAITAALAVTLWRRHLDERQVQRDRAPLMPAPPDDGDRY